MGDCAIASSNKHTLPHISPYLYFVPSFVRSVDLCAPAFIKNKRYYIIAVSFNCELSFRLNNFQYDFSDVNFDREQKTNPSEGTCDLLK